MDFLYALEDAARKAGMSQGTFLHYARGCGVYRHGIFYTMAEIQQVMQVRLAKREGGKPMSEYNKRTVTGLGAEGKRMRDAWRERRSALRLLLLDFEKKLAEVVRECPPLPQNSLPPVAEEDEEDNF